jgi:thiopeptide-type bacteriocin biosynthesis protein
MRRPWIGFRLECGSPLGPFLLDCLQPWLAQKRAEGSLGRWFYLWYTESGFHLRLRMQPARGADPERLAAGLHDLQRGAVPSFSVQRHTYDRERLAFGETCESVLGELLHGATSELALMLIAADAGGGTETAHALLRRRLLAASAAAVLTRRAIDAFELDAALDDWIAFAAEASERNRLTLPDVGGDERRVAWLNALRPIVPRVELMLDRHATTRRAVALVRRVRQRGRRGRFVATHAFHLFCNEMGMAFDQEYAVATAVRAFCSARAGDGRADPVVPARAAR